jgi:hypothetical protein
LCAGIVAAVMERAGVGVGVEVGRARAALGFGGGGTRVARRWEEGCTRWSPGGRDAAAAARAAEEGRVRCGGGGGGLEKLDDPICFCLVWEPSEAPTRPNLPSSQLETPKVCFGLSDRVRFRIFIEIL